MDKFEEKSQKKIIIKDLKTEVFEYQFTPITLGVKEGVCVGKY